MAMRPASSPTVINGGRLIDERVEVLKRRCPKASVLREVVVKKLSASHVR